METNQELEFEADWLRADKVEFKLLTMITVLADNNLAYRGTLSDMCSFFGLATRNSRTNEQLKNAIAALDASGFIHTIQDGNTWTLTLARKAEKRSKVIRIKREWYEIAKNYKNPANSVDWIQVLKLWLYLIDNQEPILKTSEIAAALNVSVSVVKKAKAALQKDIGAIVSQKVTKKDGDQYHCIGTNIVVTAWVD